MDKDLLIPLTKRLRTQNILFEQTVDSGKELKINEIARVTGRIEEILYSFRAGCRGYAKLKVFAGTDQILPEKGWLALDGITEKAIVKRPIKAGERLSAIFKNDGVFPHKLTVLVTIVGV